jgi:hypothetical protein
MSPMPPIEAQRTLVKSPPELWAELSDPASLARHLSPFGEIRIARVEPEKSVEWEADTVAGTVELKPSGWGTKVTLTVVREPPEAAAVGPVALEPAPEPAAELAASPEPTAEPGESPEPTAVAESVPEVGLESQPTTRRSRFLARFLRRRWGRTAGTGQPPAAETQTPIAEIEQTPTPATEQPTTAQAEQPPTVEAEPPQPEPAHAQVPPPNLAAELAAELALVEEAMAEQDTALLSAVLDRLGAAHHRPFSRS